MSPPTTKPGVGTLSGGAIQGPPTEVTPEVSAPPSVEPLIRAVPMPDADTPGEEDPRPRWDRANMPRNEWERALRSNDAAVARVEPGSPEFSRLMEVRVRLHFPPPAGVSLGDIDRYKQAQFEKVAGADLSRERARMDPKAPAWHRVVIIGVSACSVALVVYFVWAIVTGGVESPSPPAASSAAGPAQTTAPTANAAKAETPAASSAPPPAVEASAPTATTTQRVGPATTPPTARTTETASPAPTPTAPTAKPTSTGVKPYFD